MMDVPTGARVSVTVRGRVQAVGFRAYVGSCASQLGVAGWVRNVGDDAVESVAEGERGRLERFVEMVRTGPPGSRVDELELEWQDPTGEFEGFSVRHSV